MNQTTNIRQTHKLSGAEKERLQGLQAKIKEELPDLLAKDQLRAEAEREPTFSGSLRQAIHKSGFTVDQIAAKAALPPQHLDEFLMGTRTLRSDVIDRLALAVGAKLQAQPTISPVIPSSVPPGASALPATP